MQTSLLDIWLWSIQLEKKQQKNIKYLFYNFYSYRHSFISAVKMVSFLNKACKQMYVN